MSSAPSVTGLPVFFRAKVASNLRRRLPIGPHCQTRVPELLCPVRRTAPTIGNSRNTRERSSFSPFSPSSATAPPVMNSCSGLTFTFHWPTCFLVALFDRPRGQTSTNSPFTLGSRRGTCLPRDPLVGICGGQQPTPTLSRWNR